VKLISVVAVRLVTPVAPITPEPRFGHVMLLALRVRLWKGVLPPIAPSMVISPVPVWIARSRPAALPFTVPVIKISPAPPLVERVMLGAVTDTFPVKVIGLALVMILPPTWMIVVPVSWTAPVV